MRNSNIGLLHLLHEISVLIDHGIALGVDHMHRREALKVRIDERDERVACILELHIVVAEEHARITTTAR